VILGFTRSFLATGEEPNPSKRRIPEVATESKGSGAVIVQSVLDADLVGTVHDPLICVDAKPPGEAERLARKSAERRVKRTRPIHFASFEVK
jgi:hypothetical protein